MLNKNILVYINLTIFYIVLYLNKITCELSTNFIYI